MITFEVKTETGWVNGRNGVFDITAVEVWQSIAWVSLDGIGKRGKTINGGLRFTAEAMDSLCERWLLERGFSVKKGDAYA